MPNRQWKRRRRLAIAGTIWVVIVLAAVIGRITARPPGAASAGTTPGLGRLPAGRGWSVRSHVDARLTAAARTLAGRRTSVICWSIEDWRRRAEQTVRRYPRSGMLGTWRAFTSVRPSTINLSPQVCETLLKLPDGRPLSAEPDVYAWAVAILSHETQHVRGIDDEAEADCYGMQWIPRAAHALGRTPVEGRELAVRYWQHWYAWSQPPYWSPACQNDGALDLHLRSDVWP